MSDTTILGGTYIDINTHNREKGELKARIAELEADNAALKAQIAAWRHNQALMLNGGADE